MEPNEFAKIIARYYDFSLQALDFIDNHSISDSQADQSYYTCFKGFLVCLKNYLLLVYDDLSKTTGPMFPKSNVNKVLVRNAAEAVLILDIFRSHPELINKFYDVYLSDKNRMEMLYNGTEEKVKYLRRFAWLPRLKGRKANSLADLLNYVDFEDSEQKEFYLILIRNLDNFIHPSFHIGLSLENKSITNLDSIGALFINGGIMHELCSNLVEEMAAFYGESFSQEEFLFHFNKEASYTKQIADDCATIKKTVSHFANNVGYSLARLSIYLGRQETATYRAQNLRYLLVDLAPRYDDLMKAFYTKNSVLFAIQIRTIIESLAMIHLLMKEDERRNYIFFIHQQIKGYEATKSASELLARAGFQIPNSNLEQDYLSNIEIIREYYKNVFDKEVQTKDILRLNGWAMYLHNFENETVPNASFFVDHLFNDFLKPERRAFFNAFFEGSNAYTHITMYSFYETSKEIDKQIPIDINMIIYQMINGIVKSLNLETHMSKEEQTDFNLNFVVSMLKLNEDIKNSN